MKSHAGTNMPMLKATNLPPARVAGAIGEGELGTVPCSKTSENADKYDEQETVSHARSQFKPRDDAEGVRVDHTSRHQYGYHERRQMPILLHFSIARRVLSYHASQAERQTRAPPSESRHP